MQCILKSREKQGKINLTIFYFIHFVTYLFVHSFIHSFIHSIIYSFNHSFILCSLFLPSPPLLPYSFSWLYVGIVRLVVLVFFGHNPPGYTALSCTMIPDIRARAPLPSDSCESVMVCWGGSWVGAYSPSLVHIMISKIQEVL